METRRRFLGKAAAATAGMALGGLTARSTAHASASDTYFFFVLNTQDFAYPQYSAALLQRALDLHESLGVPLDIYLTTWMVDLLQGVPELARRLITSPMVSLAYHTRAPLPYRVSYDWCGLSSMSSADQYSVIRNYETHGLDLTTGLPVERAGGYDHFTRLIGRPPIGVGIASEAPIQRAVDTVFKDLGAEICVSNGRASNLGDIRNGLYQRPEHVDLKLFQHDGENPHTIVENALAEAPAVDGARAPYFVGVKMHDNDFFAVDSAWLTVYLAPGARRGPPWDVSLRSPLLTADEMAARWALWEGTVRNVVARGLRVVNLTQMLTMLRGTSL
jgi:hypothetical protein